MVRVVQYGLGPIGSAAARIVLGNPSLQLVGAIDVDPDLVGRDVGDVVGASRAADVAVSADAHKVLDNAHPDVVVLCTSSRLAVVAGQIRTCIAAGASVVSTCEELAYPRPENAELWKELAGEIREAGVAVLGTGVNPGFLLDVLPLYAMAACERVDRVRVSRVVDVSERRVPLQRKIGIGLTPAEFAEKARQEEIGHVGLLESLLMITDSLGVNPDAVETTLEPYVGEQDIQLAWMTVPAGRVIGIHQTACALQGGAAVVEVVLRMQIDVHEVADVIDIHGIPPVHLEIRPGLHGDLATPAIAVNLIPRLLEAPAGLVTMMEMPPAPSRTVGIHA